jgi:hypothetical protein
MTDFTTERMDELHKIIYDIIVDMDGHYLCEFESAPAYYKRVSSIAHVILHSLIDDMSEKKEI